MSGLAKVCKLYGSIKVKNSKGEETVWLYDYVNDKPRLQSEMTMAEIAASEKAKWLSVIVPGLGHIEIQTDIREDSVKT
jgi:hypothetical protein